MNFLRHAKIEQVEIVHLRPNPDNARKHDARQIDQIASSIERFGFLNPIIIDEGGLVVAGHGRLEAARQLKLEAVPVIRAAFLTEADRRAYALAENRLAELSGWDDDLLKSELEWLFEADYDLDLTGFGLEDLDLGIGPVEEGAADDAVPPAAVGPVSRAGDLWRIGPHRLLCGSSRDRSSFEYLLGGERAAMIFSDPPYNVPINGNVSRTGQHEEFAEASGEMSPAEFTSFLREIFRHCAAFSAKGSIHFHCMDWKHLREIMDAGEGVYTELKQLIVWAKSNGGMGSFYRSRHELILAFKSGRAAHVNNIRLGKGGRNRTNVWEYAGANVFRNGRDADLAAHPTVKPVAMVADAILDCSRRGDLILDPFSGSGTTILAAHRTKRRAAAIEIDPAYVDVAVERLRTVGLEAIHEDGRTFDQVRAARSPEREAAE